MPRFCLTILSLLFSFAVSGESSHLVVLGEIYIDRHEFTFGLETARPVSSSPFRGRKHRLISSSGSRRDPLKPHAPLRGAWGLSGVYFSSGGGDSYMRSDRNLTPPFSGKERHSSARKNSGDAYSLRTVRVVYKHPMDYASNFGTHSPPTPEAVSKGFLNANYAKFV